MKFLNRLFRKTPSHLNFHELNSLDTDWGQQALAIYEEAFPLEERESTEELAETIHNPHEEDKRHHFRIMVDATGEVIGISLLTTVHSNYMSFLRFFAIRHDMRSKGYGRYLLDDTKATVRQDGWEYAGYPYLGIALEVEHPDEATNPEEFDIRQRRIAWYQRNGVRLIPDTRLITPPANMEYVSMHYLLMFATVVPKIARGNRLRRMMVETILLGGYGETPDSPYLKQSLEKAR